MKRAVWLTRNHHGTTWVKDGRVPVVQYGNDQLKVLPCDLKSNFLRTKTCMRLSLIKSLIFPASRRSTLWTGQPQYDVLALRYSLLGQ